MFGSVRRAALSWLRWRVRTSYILYSFTDVYTRYKANYLFIYDLLGVMKPYKWGGWGGREGGRPKRFKVYNIVYIYKYIHSASFQNSSKNNTGVFVCAHDVNCNKVYEMAWTFFKNTYFIVDEMRIGFY